MKNISLLNKWEEKGYAQFKQIPRHCSLLFLALMLSSRDGYSKPLGTGASPIMHITNENTVANQAAQYVVVGAKVLDENGHAIEGISVLEKGTSNGTKTNREGLFSLRVKSKDALLLFSGIGFKSMEASVSDLSSGRLVLVRNEQMVDEVVVTAYGKVKKSSLTDAVATVSGEKLENRPIRSISDGLIGLSPGVNIRMPSGAPETNPTLNIRGFTSINGSASPLVLVDGVERPIQDVNPNDVESISILKDGASTAIYGSRAPYGIILITTKSGKSGKMQVTYSGNVKIGKRVLFPTQPESPEWARYINMAQKNGWPNGTGTDGVDAITIARMEAWLRKDWNNPAFDELRTQFGDKAQQYIENGQFPTTNAGFKNWTREQSFATTNLYEAYLNKSAVSSQHNVNLSGGTDRIQYFSSLGYSGTKGLFKSDLNDNKRYNFQTKLNYKANDWLDLRTDVNYVLQKNLGPNYRAGSASDAGSGATVANYGDIFGSMMQYFATPLKVPSGKAYSWILGAAGIMGEGGSIANERNEMVLTGGATVKPLKYLEFSGDYTYRVSNSQFTKVDKVVYTELPDGTKIQNNRSANISSISKSAGTQKYQFAKFSGQYSRSFADTHNVFLQAGMQLEDNDFQSLTGSKTDLFAQDVIEALNAAANNPLANDNMYSWGTLGYYGVASYDYKQKYMIKVAGRRDASSRFAPESRWGFFPSVSAAWNIGKETFWPFKDLITDFKPRASWSTSGDLTSVGGNNYYTYLPTLGFSVNKTTLLGGNYANVATAPGLVSQTLTWAKPTVLNLGIDITALNRRLNVVYEWYQRRIIDQMGPANPVSAVLGTGAPQLNNSESETRGWELSIGWNDKFILAGKPFNYDLKLNMSDYIGYVTKYSANQLGLRSGYWTPGELFGQNYMYATGGIAQRTENLNGRTLTGEYNYPGYLMYKDLDGDGYIGSGTGGFWYSMGDQIKNGFNYPRRSYSILPSFSWNNFNFSAVLEGVMHWKVFTSSEWIWGSSAGGGGTAYFYTPVFKESSSLGYWTPDNTDAFFPALNTSRSLASDAYTLNLAHLRIRNITVGYNIPEKLISRAGLKRVNVYFSGENLGFIFNKSFIKYDPELLSNLGGLFSASTNGYPPLRYYSVGVNISL
ncbi:SusC/RagA family TonB-linked outer membrane protein [Sphingobacterium detergens]